MSQEERETTEAGLGRRSLDHIWEDTLGFEQEGRGRETWQWEGRVPVGAQQFPLVAGNSDGPRRRREASSLPEVLWS